MIRKKIPKRINRGKVYKSYQGYRKYLEIDFNKRCGYCDTRDDYMHFHIDHFAPKTIFPKYKLDYNNLVYSCPYCNLSKSDKWPMKKQFNPSHDGIKGFVDPCSQEYDKHLIRDANGQIKSRTELGKYMVKEMKLYLKRHQYSWIFEKIEDTLDYMEKNNLEDDEKYSKFCFELHKLYRKINQEINRRN